LDKSHSVFPPEIHQIVDPYLNKVEQRLNPNFQPDGQDMQQLWQSQVKANAPAGWPQLPQLQWPQTQPTQSQPQPQPGWPTSSQAQPGWPATPSAQPRTADSRDPYSFPREPQPFPGPYSAEVPASRDY
jgi:hypothetical protein